MTNIESLKLKNVDDVKFRGTFDRIRVLCDLIIYLLFAK